MKSKVISGDQLWTIVVPTGQRLLVYSRDRKVFRLHPKTICAAFAQLDFEIAAGNELINPKRKE